MDLQYKNNFQKISTIHVFQIFESFLTLSIPGSQENHLKTKLINFPPKK